MKKKRLIPVLLLKDGWLVQSKKFERYQNLGNPITSVKRLSEWASDELIYLNISKSENYDLRRDDQGYPNRSSFKEIIKDVARETFMPMTVGGRIRTVQDIREYLSLGADKVSVNTQALAEPDFISRAAREFGSQCLVVSVDIKKIDGKNTVMAEGGRKQTHYNAVEWVRLAEAKGAGEILLNSIDRDGQQNGFDIELIKQVSGAVRIPVIALGGAGQWSDFAEVFRETRADAVAAANIFQYKDQSVYLAKKYLYDNNHNVRTPELMLSYQ